MPQEIVMRDMPPSAKDSPGCLVSVIIPLYNNARYLERCVGSIIEKNYPNLEIVIVDDCSTDDGALVARELCSKYSFIKLISHSANKGTFAARETAIRNARGEYIFCVDPDDHIDGGIFRSAEKKNFKYDIIAYDTLMMFADHTWYFGNKERFVLKGEEIAASYARVDILNWSVYPKFIRREIAVKALDELAVDKRLVFAEDFLLFLTCCLFSTSYIHYPRVCYYYDNIQNDGETRKLFNLEDLRRKIFQNTLVYDYFYSVLKRNNKEHIDFSETREHMASNLYRMIQKTNLDSAGYKELMFEMGRCHGGLAMLNIGINIGRSEPPTLKHLIKLFLLRFLPPYTRRRQFVKAVYTTLKRIKRLAQSNNKL